MDIRQQIDAKHLEVFGRKAPKNAKDETLIKKIEKETGESLILVDAPPKPAPTPPPKPAPEEVKTSGLSSDTEETHKGNLVFKGAKYGSPIGEHLVYIDGSPR